MRRALQGPLAGPLPVADGGLVLARGGAVPRHHLGLRGHHLGKARLAQLHNLLMHPLPRALEQRGIRRILDQGVLERIGGPRRPPPLVQQFRPDQLRQPRLQGRFVLRREGLEHLIGKLPPQHRPHLRHLFGRMQLIQAGHERILQGVGNRHAPQRPGQRVVVHVLPQQGRLQQHLGQFFDIERHPIRLGHDVLHHLGGQRLAPRQVRDQRFDLRPLQAVEGDGRHMRAGRPGRGKLRAIGQHVQHRHRRRLLQHQSQHLQRGRVGPVQVFPRHHHRLAFGFLQHPGHQRIEGLLLLLLGGERRGA